ncbi:MAG: hypothetical protein L6R41_005669 [Letrouitia leprolyta]|nr:MAG: hypothetical protein L6R41_005669 [Letrouitia leprolyta]
MLFSLFTVAACFASIVSAFGTPPGYLPSTNQTLGLKLGNITVKSASILPAKAVKPHPTLSLPTASSTDKYLAILIDSAGNLTLPNPASLLWFQSNLTFPPSPLAASSNTNATVPYLAPSIPGHIYIALLYKQPPNFILPPDFPYNNIFRKNFNVSRLAVDFKTGGPVAANFFELASYGVQNASITTGERATVTGHVNVTSTVSLFQFATAAPRPFVGDARRATGGKSFSRVSLVVLMMYIMA